MKRGSVVDILVDNKVPYLIKDREGRLVGSTLQGDKGIYIKNATFKVRENKPVITGIYLGDISEFIFNHSKGTGVMFDYSKNAFTDGENYVKRGRLVQLLNGAIKIVL